MFRKVATVGERILYYRKLKDITLAELSALTGTPFQTLNRYELTQRTPNVIVTQNLAEKMGVNLLWLQGYDAPMYAPLQEILLTADETEIIDCYRVLPDPIKQSYLDMLRATARTLESDNVSDFPASAAFGGTTAKTGITEAGAKSFIEATNEAKDGKKRKKRGRKPKTTNN